MHLPVFYRHAAACSQKMTRNPLPLLLFLLVPLLTSCPLPTDTATGSLRITFQDTISRTLTPPAPPDSQTPEQSPPAASMLPGTSTPTATAGSKGFPGSDTDMDTIYSPGFGNALAQYDVKLEGPDDTLITSNGIEETGYAAYNLLPGEWTVTVVGRDADGNYRGEGSKTVTIEPNKTNEITLDIGFKGTATCSFTLNWASDTITNPRLSGSITPNGSSEALSLNDLFVIDAEACSATATISTIPAGNSIVSIILKDGTQTVWDTTNALILDGGSTTSWSKTLTLANLRLANISLNIGSTLPSIYDLTIHTYLATGLPFYRISAADTSGASKAIDSHDWILDGVTLDTYRDADLPLYLLDRPGSHQLTVTARIDGTTYSTGGSISRSTATARKFFTSSIGSTFFLAGDGSSYSTGYDCYRMLQHATAGDTSTFKPTTLADSLDTPIAALEGSSNFMLALLESGELWAWGGNNFGMLGDGTTTNRTTPVKVGFSSSAKVRYADAGTLHALAILEDGSLYGWGLNNKQQLLGTSTTQYATPTPIPGLSHVIDVSAGLYASFAVTADGSLYAWGQNTYGELGIGSTESVSEPTRLTDIPACIAVEACGYTTYAITADHKLYAWGDGYSGSLGNGSTDDQSSPVEIMSDVIDISCGSHFAIALKADGSLWSWGDNTFGQLGDGTRTKRTSPVKIMDAGSVRSIGTGEDFAIAQKVDGSLYAWGSNNCGQLGLGYVTPNVYDDFHINLESGGIDSPAECLTPGI